ncbi:MAG: fumarylacetoacetate hydrolase family protein [Acidimicrobiales bacterium]|nr:fumarylacetoacetate hydrolase family protein [Acidimicrobiales bacterium]
MKFVTCRFEGRTTWGAVTEDNSGVIDLGRRLPDLPDLSTALRTGRLTEAQESAGWSDADFDLADADFERTIPRPGKIFCIGVNYGGRNAEYADSTSSNKPSVFVRFPESLTGHQQPLIRPPESVQLDYEGEIVAVIGQQGRRIPRGQARDYIAGLTLGNEGTIRDWLRHAKFNVTQGKNWESSGSMGPWLVTLDEIGDFEDLRLQTHVNGELRQDDTVASMAFSIEFQIEYLSTFITLEPGDVIYTGTPTGAGARLEPPQWLEPGDVVQVSVDGIGTLENTIEDEGPC